MANTVYNFTNYYSIFKSPLSPTELNPQTKLIYGSAASKMYTQSIANAAKSTMSSYLTSLNTNIGNLKSSAKPLYASGSDSSFEQKSVTSTDSKGITGTASANADLASYTLNVSKLATSQVNNGNQLNSNAINSFSSGMNTIKLDIGDTQKSISFNIGEQDTNKMALDKMAKGINASKVGVTATVISDEKAGTSYLKLTGDDTGTDNAFTISDKLGTAVAASGISSIARQSENSIYTLDDRQLSSHSNTIRLNNDKVKVTFNKADGKDIKLSVGTDENEIKSDIENLVKNYNSVISFVNTSSSTIGGAEKLGGELNNIIKSRKNSLETIGITLNSDRTLSVDSKKLSSAINKNPSLVKDLFGGYNGLAEKINKKSNEVMSSPIKYSTQSETSLNQETINTMPNATNNNPFKSLGSSSALMQNIYRKGLVVDTFI